MGFSVSLHAEWRTWRGPSKDGISTAKNLPDVWNEKENVLWKFALPAAGSSTPIVVGDKVFLTLEKDKEVQLLCLSTEGKELWLRKVCETNGKGNGERTNASATPSSDGEKVFVTQAVPGWASPEGELADPRKGKYPPLGPLSREWSKFGGHYVHGDRVVLKYSVGAAQVLESPSLYQKGEAKAIVRTIRIEGDGKPKIIVLSDVAEGCSVALAHAPKGAKVEVVDGINLLSLSAFKNVLSFQVVYARGDASSLVGSIPAPADLLTLTKRLSKST